MKQSRKRKTAVPKAKKGKSKGSDVRAKAGKVMTSQKEQKGTRTTKGELTMEEKKGFAGFEIKHVSEDVLKMMKFSLDTTFETVTKIQDFNEKIVKEMIKTNEQIQGNAEEILDEWIENGKKGIVEYRKAVGEGFKKVEEFLQSQK